MTHYRVSIAAILVIAVLALVGCGGDDAGETVGATEQNAIAADGAAATDGASAADEPAASDDTAVIEAQPAPAQTVEAIGMSLTWGIDGDRLRIALSGPTDGWIAVGFRPSRAMKDADIHIGYVDGQTVVMTDQFGTGLITHAPDEELGGTTDIGDLSGEEIDGTTTIRYSIPLDSGDDYDQPLTPGETLPVILAWGRADNTSGAHRDRTTIEITL